MEKINIAVGFRNGEAEILKQGGVDEVLVAYREAELDESFEFVGMLRKPTWYKRNTPKLNAEREAERKIAAEQAEVINSRVELDAEIADAKRAADAIAEANRIEAEAHEAALAEQARLNAEIEKMQREEQESEQAALDAKALASAEAAQDNLAPTAEEEARAAVVADSAPAKGKKK